MPDFDDTASVASDVSAPEVRPFDDVRFRYKNSYIKDVIAATMNLTVAEASRIKSSHQVALMPIAHVEDYDEALEHHMLTIRWKLHDTTMQTVLAACEKLQNHPQLNAYAYPITYGNIRVTANAKLTRENVNIIREIVSADKNVIVMPDVPLPREELGTAWKAKRTLFVPGQRSESSESTAPHTTKIRRVIQTTGTMSWQAVIDVAKHLRCTLVDCQDTHTLSPLSYVVEWEEKERKWVEELESSPTEVTLGKRRIQIHVLKPRASV